MSLIRVDWNPSKRKIRRFGLGLIIFTALLGAAQAWKGPVRQGIAAALIGAALGLACAALPERLGKPVYKIWMGVSYVIGSIVSAFILALIYFGMLTPLALILRLSGRDALRLKRTAQSSYWLALSIPKGKSYLERLF